MLIKAILVGLVLGLCKSEWIYGFPQVGRPIVVSTLTGLFLGDPVQGVIMGSVLELMFIGSFPIGAAVSPDYTSAGAICTAFAILTGGGKAVATAMALPIALLGGFLESKAADEKNQEVTTRKVVSKEYVDHALHGDKE